MRIVQSPPALAAVELADVQAHARVFDADEADALADMALTATLELEHQANIALLTRTVEVRVKGWPVSGSLPLPIGPVQAGAAAVVTVDGAAFDGFDLLPGRIGELRLTGELTDALEVAEIVASYPAGFGASPADVPADLRHAVLDQVAHLYDARGAVDARRAMAAPAFLRIAAKHRGAKV